MINGWGIKTSYDRSKQKNKEGIARETTWWLLELSLGGLINRLFASKMARSYYFRQILNEANSDNYMTPEKRCTKIIRNRKKFLNEAGWSKPYICNILRSTKWTWLKRANWLPVTSILSESVCAKRRTFMVINKAFASKQKLP